MCIFFYSCNFYFNNMEMRSVCWKIEMFVHSMATSFPPGGCQNNRMSLISSSSVATTRTTCSFHKNSSTVASSSSQNPQFLINKKKLCELKFCSCGSRRHFVEGTATAFLPLIAASSASSPPESDPTAVLKRFHPPRPDWYEELYAWVINYASDAYEEELAGYKTKLFDNLRGKAKKILEIGIGTGPNLKYYAGDTDVQVIGVDPNKKMEKYAQAAAVAAGLPLSNFNFLQAVGELIPVSDASVDAVVGTLVLCSVKDVDMTLQEVRRVLKPGGTYLFVEHVAAKDGTLHKFWQSVLDPLQQTVADGCHLTRQTGKYISEAGFSAVELGNAFVSHATLLNPHVYGIARK